MVGHALRVRVSRVASELPHVRAAIKGNESSDGVDGTNPVSQL